MNRAKVLVAVGLMAAAALGAAPPLPNPQDATQPGQGVGTLNDYLVSTPQDVQLRDGQLYIDALNAKGPVFALRRDKAFENVNAVVQFKMDPVGQQRGFGLVFGSTDGSTYHAVYVDRTSVVLYEYRPGQPPKELARRGGFTKPDGQWYEAKVETSGPQVKVFFDGKYLFAFNSPQLQTGHVGFYANGGRAWVRRFEMGGTPSRALLPQTWGPRK